MPKNEQDPAGNTQQFRAFANRGDAAPSGPKNTGLIIGGAIGLLVVIVVIALLVI